MLADGRLPAGGHSQSAGLEAAVGAGLGLADVPAYIAARLASVIPVDAATAALTARRLGRLTDELAAEPDGTTGETVEPVGRCALDLRLIWLEWASRTTSPVLRDAAERAGRGYSRLAGVLWPAFPGLEAARLAQAAIRESRGARPAHLPRPLAMGLIAAAAGLDGQDAARLAGYDDAAAVATACAKLLPADPDVSARWLAEALPRIEAAVAPLASLDDPRDIPAAAAPQIEAWGADHARRPERLFHA
jgi:urease accessory protein